MNTSQPFNTPGEQPHLFQGETLPDTRAEQLEPSQSPSPTESQWQRVLGVVLVEGQIRYVVERGE